MSRVTSKIMQLSKPGAAGLVNKVSTNSAAAPSTNMEYEYVASQYKWQSLGSTIKYGSSSQDKSIWAEKCTIQISASSKLLAEEKLRQETKMFHVPMNQIIRQNPSQKTKQSNRVYRILD